MSGGQEIIAIVIVFLAFAYLAARGLLGRVRSRGIHCQNCGCSRVPSGLISRRLRKQ